MKVLAVGDIHCKPEIVDKVKQAVDAYDKIVFIGDYADDWGKTPMDTINIWKKVKGFQDEYPNKVLTLIGNHDYAYILGYNPHSGGFNPLTMLQLSSLENRPLLKWLREMPVLTTIEDVMYSHAGVDKSWDGELNNDSLWADNSPIWTRPSDSDYVGKLQVFGHTPSRTCHRITENIWCIDTFSTYRDGSPIGDETVLEITDGKQFKVIEIDKLTNDNINNTDSIKD